MYSCWLSRCFLIFFICLLSFLDDNPVEITTGTSEVGFYICTTVKTACFTEKTENWWRGWFFLIVLVSFRPPLSLTTAESDVMAEMEAMEWSPFLEVTENLLVARTAEMVATVVISYFEVVIFFELYLI